MTKPHTTLSEAIRSITGIIPEAYDKYETAAHRAAFNAGLGAAAKLIEQHEAQEPVAPAILEALSYHGRERDDLTLEEAVSVIRSGWRTVSGRSERAMVLQIAALLAAQPPQVSATPVDGCQGEIATAEKSGGLQTNSSSNSSNNSDAGGLSAGDQWHSLTCDGTCSPPCKDAPPLQRYVWGGAPTAPLKHLTAHEGPFYACADVDALRPTASPTPVAEDASRAAQEADAWISVQDRLPSDDDVVMAWNGDSIVFERWMERHENPVEWSSVTVPIGQAWDEHEFEEITHWMPLPSAPTTDKKG